MRNADGTSKVNIAQRHPCAIEMMFDRRGHNGASTLITAMLVAIVALAGTAVYAAVSSNANHDGYALPGTTLEYEMSGGIFGGLKLVLSPTVVGYSDEYVFNKSTIGSDAVSAWGFADDLKNKSSSGVNVNVPGLGKTSGSSYTITDSGETLKVITILHGMVYSVDSESGYTMKLVSGDFKLGEYKAPGIKAQTLKATSGSSTLDLNCVSISTDGNYMFEFAGVNGYDFYYVGNDKGIPTDLGTKTSYQISNGSGYYATMTFADGALSSITVNSTTYKV